ncbi:MAG: serine/threonine-protein phosphatase [Nitrospiraceae bacterium]|nr:MAG: serine/threonine-protein phosphatase [Nitrospiraceae bacterium]
MLTLKAHGRSELGLHREGNEDAALLSTTLCAVADGLGGHAAGEIASRFAIDTLSELINEKKISSSKISKQVREVDKGLATLIEGEKQYGGMGTTLTAVVIIGQTLQVAHIGDSRAYLYRNGTLKQLTKDHTMIQEMIDRGEITTDGAKAHPKRALLTQALMGQKKIQPDLVSIDIFEGDRLLICSDGLSNVVNLSSMASALNQLTSEGAVDTLIALTYAAGAPDNVTVLVADVVSEKNSTQPVFLGSAVDLT